MNDRSFYIRNVILLISINILAKVLLVSTVSYITPQDAIHFIHLDGTDWQRNWHALNITSDNRPLADKLGYTFDSLWFVNIAHNGYVYDKSMSILFPPSKSYCMYIFPPLYPLFIKGFSFFLGYVLAGLLVSNLASIIAVILFYTTALNYLDSNSAFRAAILFSLYPHNLVFWTLSFSDSLYTVFLLLSWIFLDSGKLISAGFFMMLSSFTRLPGMVLFPLLSVVYVIKRPSSMRVWRLVLGISCLGLFAMPMLYWMFLQVKTETGNTLYDIRSLCSGDSLLSGLPGLFSQSLFGLLFTYFAILGVYYLKDVDRTLQIYSMGFMFFYIVFSHPTLGVVIPRYIGTIWPLFIYYGKKLGSTDVCFYSVVFFAIASLIVILQVNQVSAI